MLVKGLVWYLVSALCLIAVVPHAEAGFSPSPMVACPSVERMDAVGKIQAVLERKAVESRLQELGFSAAEISSRLDQLSDGQLHRVAAGLDQLRVGRGGEGVLIGVLIIILIIGVILPLMGIKVWK